MIDISKKSPTARAATARATVILDVRAAEAVRNRTNPKGDVLECARVAGIMAAKNTPSIIPLCHPLNIEHVKLQFDLKGTRLEIVATVRCAGKTGVEMEALTAAAVAALTVYDMSKIYSKNIEIRRVVLLSKSGGKSGDYRRR